MTGSVKSKSPTHSVSSFSTSSPFFFLSFLLSLRLAIVSTASLVSSPTTSRPPLHALLLPSLTADPVLLPSYHSLFLPSPSLTRFITFLSPLAHPALIIPTSEHHPPIYHLPRSNHYQHTFDLSLWIHAQPLPRSGRYEPPAIIVKLGGGFQFLFGLILFNLSHPWGFVEHPSLIWWTVLGVCLSSCRLRNPDLLRAGLRSPVSRPVTRGP